MQAIIIPGSLESRPTYRMESARVARVESKEVDPVPSALQVDPIPSALQVDPIPSALQVIPPSDRDEGQPSRSKFMRSGLLRPTLSEWIITNCYVPPRGPEPSRVEVSTPKEDEVKYIMRQ